MPLLFVTLVALVFLSGIITSLVAQARGRSPGAWFFAGTVLPVFALILIMALPEADIAPGGYSPRTDLNPGPRHRHRAPEASVRPPALPGRPNLHSVRAPDDDEDEEVKEAAPAPGSPHAGGTPKWYVMRGLKRIGPFTLPQIKRVILDNQVGPGNVVWHPDRRAWFHREELLDEFGGE